jgi:hypothetical protein
VNSSLVLHTWLPNLHFKKTATNIVSHSQSSTIILPLSNISSHHTTKLLQCPEHSISQSIIHHHPHQMSYGLIPREAGSRSMVWQWQRAAHGRLEEEDGGSALRWRWGQGRWQWHGIDQEQRTYDLRKRMTMMCFEARVKAVACSEAGDEAMACSGARIEDDRQRQHWWQSVVEWRFLGRQKSKRERGVEKLLSVVRESVGPKILGWGT